MDFFTSEQEQEYEEFWDSLNNENLTEEEYLSRILGPKHLPPKLVIPLTLAYVTIFVSGVVGNIATCVVIIKNSTMRSATNYYLFSLAISDLILLSLGLPNELSGIWQQYPWALGLGLCKIRAYVSEMSSYVSVLTIVAFSMERYLAICHPLRAYAMSGPRRPIMIIIAAWLIAIIAAVPFAIYTKVNYVEYPPDSGINSASSAICAMLLPDMPHFPLYELSCVVFFLIPMLIILAVYTRMGLKIRKSTRNSVTRTGESSAHWDSRQVQSRRSIIRMLSAVVIMFFLCWAPFHAQRLLYVYAQEADYYPDLNEWLYIFSGFLYYFSTTINPILYNLMSLRYREAFKRTVCCGKSRSNGRRPQELNFCRCDSQRVPHVPTIRCSVRYTIDQAKDIFKLSTNHHECEKDTRLPDLHGARDPNRNIINKPLLEDEHPLVREKTSFESTTSGDKSRGSISTASSFL
ncbi:neuropeptides capa receptor [Fopius arisanus]|uniref:CapaR_2 protein n=1 Tax=Fopius arisanus TaxID=64838 RepID=A0A0C9RTW4_9HYME|nr:PREDICTED: neuropeptides capa receptor-like [Fopius arisanus]